MRIKLWTANLEKIHNTSNSLIISAAKKNEDKIGTFLDAVDYREY